MKSFEIEQMWINKGISQGIEQGRSEERANTLREKARADRLERAEEATEGEMMFLGEFLGVWAWGLFFCGWGEFFLWVVVRGLGDRGWFGYVVEFFVEGLCKI